MDFKSVGASAFKINQAAESLAKTDDMLAVLGIIMLMGVIISAYGSFWQGRLASLQYHQSVDPKTQSVVQGKTTRYAVIITLAVLLIIGLMVYIFRKQIKTKLVGGTVAA